MPTVYLRSDSYTVNTISAHKIGLSNSATYCEHASLTQGSSFGFDLEVYRVQADGTSTQIGSTVNIVTHACGAGFPSWYHSDTPAVPFACPDLTLLKTDAIEFVIVIGTDPADNIRHITPQLGVEHIPASTWTVNTFWYESGVVWTDPWPPPGPVTWGPSYCHGDGTAPAWIDDFPVYIDSYGTGYAQVI
jgi:hypothetical protein